MIKVWKRVGALTLAGTLAISSPFVGVFDSIAGDCNNVTSCAASRYSSFSNIVSAIKWGTEFLKDAKKMYKDKSKINHVYNVSTVAKYYYWKCNKDIGKAISKIIEDNAMKPVNLGLRKKSSDAEVKKVVTAYLIGCLAEYEYIQESGYLDNIIVSNKNVFYDFVYASSYFKEHRKYALKHSPYEYMASHTDWATKAAASGKGTGYMDKQNFTNLKVIIEKAVEFLY